MASVTVLVWRIDVTYNNPYNLAGYEAGNYIHCILDDVTLAMSVQIRTASSIGGGSLVSSPVSGPSIFFGDGGSSTTSFPGTPTPLPLWARCDGTTYQRVTPINSYPFAAVGSFPNSSQCVVSPVCDLTISDVYSVTPASGPSISDGSVTISATSSNGVIRYSLTEGFEYASGQTSTTFSPLVPGDYTIYAKDEVGCTDEIDITIPVTTVYGVKYRFEYDIIADNISTGRSRVDIEERAYSGSITEPDCAGVPVFVLRSIGEDDKYHPLWYGNAEFNAMTNINLQWQEFFNTDDQKYKFKHYRFETDWTLKYVGFVVPSLYSEPYLDPPFQTTITISDRLGNLKDEDFLDDDGNELRQANSQMFIIAMILRKTGLNLSIRSCIDLLETTMTATADDDVLPQAYVDCRIYYSDKGVPKKCDQVLKEILEPYGAYIKCAEGYFWIIRQERSIGDLDYRQFDYNGEFEESAIFESLRAVVHPRDLVSANQFKWRDRQQMILFQQNFGEFNIVHDLLPDNNLIDSGAFELHDITETGGQQGFIDWNVFVAQAGLRYGYEAVKNGESKGAFFFDWSQVNASQADNILYSKKLRVATSVFEFSFQYYVEPEFSNIPFVRIAYQVKATRVSDSTVFYYSPFGVWDSTVLKNEIFVTTYNSFQKFERRLPNMPGASNEIYDVEISFFAHDHQGADIVDTDFSELRDISTAGQFTPGKRIYYYDQTDSVMRFYTLRESNETESLPDRVRPSDYSSPTNTKVWFLDSSMSLGFNQSFVRKTLFDNVVFNQLVLIVTPVTYYSDAPNPATYTMTTEILNKRVFTKEVTLGDVPGDDGEVTLARVPNPEVYRGWLRLADGTPTELWKRRDIDEEAPLLELLVNDVASQFRDPTQKITGVLMGTGFLSPIHSIQDMYDDKKYIILAYEVSDRENSFRVTLAEVVTGADGFPPPDDSEFTEEFTTEYIA